MSTDTDEGKVALVTGAGSGIGRAVALRFAAEGFAVACADIDTESARAVADAIAREGGEAKAIHADVSDEVSVTAMAAEVLSWKGRLDSAVSNAGIMVEGDVLSVSPEDWNRAMAVNLNGAFLTARATLPHLLESKGTLVFTASTVALAGMRGIAAYSASKGAVAALTRQIAADFASSGVRVNAVAPGAVRTRLSEAQFAARATDEAQFEAMVGQAIARYPIARWGEPEEVAEAVLFLATDRSSWMTGQVLPVDGGLLELR